ncbi:hypothetical protein BH11PSE3_BH11PSE3_30930 [soil metagenome]
MTALIYLMMAVAIMIAASGYRGVAIGLFGVSLVTAIVWFYVDITDPLNLVF